MDIFTFAERSMGMDDGVWMRHANPWSVWTRILTPLPLFIAAVFSRVWLGGWASLPVGLVLLWIWLNPRLFAVPRTLHSWGAQGVLGERVFLRARQQVSKQHLVPAYSLTALSALGLLPLAYGLYVLDIWAALCGAVMISGFKTWFLDRMVWVWQDFQRMGLGLADLSDKRRD